MSYIHIDDICVHYEIQGEGRQLILLHGNGEDLSYFRYQISAFAQMYQVICLDTRGHGQTTRGKKNMTFSVLSEDVAHFMNAMHIAHAYILGFSDGANIALQLALDHHDKIDGLILNSPNLDPKGLLLVLRIQMRIEYCIGYIMAYFHKPFLRKKELLELMLNQPNMNENMLKNIWIDTLLIVGEHDMIRMSHTQKIAQALPYCQCKVISNGDHFVAMKIPHKFNEEVLRFLGNCK